MCHFGLGYRLFYMDAVPDEAFAFYLFPREKKARHPCDVATAGPQLS